MVEQDGRGHIQKESESVLHLSSGQRSHYRTVPGVEGSPRVISQGRAFKGFRAGLGRQNRKGRYSAKGKPSPTSCRGDLSYPCCPGKPVEAVKQEVEKLKEVGAIKETFFLEWLANTVVVKKKNSKWRVYVDFTDLNQACLKDPFPMPKIDQLVDATYGHPRMSFLDAFQGYHQITLAAEDQEKMAFISPDANYHYTVMPFGLKNAGATYQRMMTRMFRDKIRHLVEVYIDNMVVKSKQEARHVKDLQGVFEVLRKHRLHLNAEKCAFGVGAGKFLGYLITSCGIEVNPDQIEAVKCLRSPSNPKEVQVLTGMLATLNWFISKFLDRCHPFYQLLKKWKGFRWDNECEKAFQDFKEYLT